MATLIRTNGECIKVTPKHGKYFTLEELQKFVGGYIEIAYINRDKMLIVNEDGKLQNLPYNGKATALYNNIHDYIVGDALLVTSDEID